MLYSDLWLDYRRKDIDKKYTETICCGSEKAAAAARELVCAVTAMTGTEPELRFTGEAPRHGIYLEVGGGGDYTDPEIQAYSIRERDGLITVRSESAAGVLWGAFELIRRFGTGGRIEGMDETFTPDAPLRMLDHWDNSDGSIERGYSGSSFFFRDGELVVDDRTRMYARLVSSVGINAVVLNNVNVDERAARLITDRYFDRLSELSKLFGEYGIRLFLSIDFAAPIDIGGLDTADPLDERVGKWWADTADKIYEALPEFGGFLVKADSEGRPGPYAYGRDQADGANVLARALKKHGGIVIWRCFVYNCTQDWRDKKTDRARACYDNFIGLDGRFEDNVILQIKNGPVDFQVREPVSPLFGAMKATNQMMEVQIAQEYTGQQRDLFYLIPWFKEVLDFRMYQRDENDTAADYINGKAYKNRLCGIAAVCNTGDDYNWTGHDLAAANLYGFGRLSFDNSLTAEKIAEEWIIQTMGDDPEVKSTIEHMLMTSRYTYEKYTAPLGVGWMVAPSDHYGPDVDGFEYSRWGTYHYADRDGIGVDRTENGTGYVMQYSQKLRELYGSIESCPDELALFFHHLPYTHALKSGETVIQHIYNTHFEGVSEVEEYIRDWEKLRGKVAEDVFFRVSERLLMQLKNAREWRDVINTYFYRKSGIDDMYGRKIYR